MRADSAHKVANQLRQDRTVYVLCFPRLHTLASAQVLSHFRARPETAQLTTIRVLAPAQQGIPNLGQERAEIGGFLHKRVGLRVSDDMVGIVRIA